MSSFHVRRRSLAGAIIVLSMLATGPRARSSDDGGGELWEVIALRSTQESSPRTPPPKVQVCVATGWTRPPGVDDVGRGCVGSDFQVKGIKTTWAISCKGPPAMTGTGEIYRDSKDEYNGTIHYESAEGKVVVSLSGRRVGACDQPQ